MKNYLALVFDEQWGCVPIKHWTTNTKTQGTTLQFQPLQSAEKQPQTL